MQSPKKSFPLFLCCLISWFTVKAEIKPNALISDRMVLQRNIEVPIWGSAKDGEMVTVSFADQTVSDTAKDGRWSVRLAPMKANASPQTMTITGENIVTINDVLVGEVWVCGGQSNMAWPLDKTADANTAIKSANDPGLRFFTVPYEGGAAEPQSDVGGTWSACTSETAAPFSAVGYYFGRDIREAVKVPVGLINSNRGGTPVEQWLSLNGFQDEPGLEMLVKDREKRIADYPEALAKFKANEAALLEKWQVNLQQAKNEGKTGRALPSKPAPPLDPALFGMSSLYNKMIAPLQPFAIRGVIWYQGEANNGNPEQYKTLFPALIQDWRKGWAQGDFPFLFVQIAPFESMKPEIREAQRISLEKTSNTAMVVTTDYGEATNLHPVQKEPIGARLALAARALAYGEKIEYSGPLIAKMTVDGAKAILSFTHIGGGLVAHGADLKGFTVSGDGRTFVPAEAKIVGQTVVVSSPEVSDPKEVRFGWANVPDVNLFNKDGLPASPFRIQKQ